MRDAALKSLFCHIEAQQVLVCPCLHIAFVHLKALCCLCRAVAAGGGISERALHRGRQRLQHPAPILLVGRGSMQHPYRPAG